MKHIELLEKCVKIAKERTKQYKEEPSVFFDKVAQGMPKQQSSEDVLNMMIKMKQLRQKTVTDPEDDIIDEIVYTAILRSM